MSNGNNSLVIRMINIIINIIGIFIFSVVVTITAVIGVGGIIFVLTVVITSLLL